MKDCPSLKLILEEVHKALALWRLSQNLNSFDGSRLCSKPAGGSTIKVLFTPKDPLGPFVVEGTIISRGPKKLPMRGIAFIYGGK